MRGFPDARSAARDAPADGWFGAEGRRHSRTSGRSWRSTRWTACSSDPALSPLPLRRRRPPPAGFGSPRPSNTSSLSPSFRGSCRRSTSRKSAPTRRTANSPGRREPAAGRSRNLTAWTNPPDACGRHGRPGADSRAHRRVRGPGPDRGRAPQRTGDHPAARDSRSSRGSPDFTRTSRRTAARLNAV